MEFLGVYFCLHGGVVDHDTDSPYSYRCIYSRVTLNNIYHSLVLSNYCMTSKTNGPPNNDLGE